MTPRAAKVWLHGGWRLAVVEAGRKWARCTTIDGRVSRVYVGSLSYHERQPDAAEQARLLARLGFVVEVAPEIEEVGS